jgi:hypothetical protein
MSAFYDILNAIKTRIAVTYANTKLRKRAIMIETDTLPLFIVSPGTETIGLEAFNGVVCYDYTVQVTYVDAGNRIFETDLAAHLTIRENIKKILYQPALTGVSDVIGMQLDMQPAFESVSGNVNNYDVCGMTITYRKLEARTS